jgi:hypothetical protein
MSTEIDSIIQRYADTPSGAVQPDRRRSAAMIAYIAGGGDPKLWRAVYLRLYSHSHRERRKVIASQWAKQHRSERAAYRREQRRLATKLNLRLDKLPRR